MKKCLTFLSDIFKMNILEGLKKMKHALCQVLARMKSNWNILLVGLANGTAILTTGSLL